MAKQAITLKIAGKSYPFNIESGKEEMYRLAEREVNSYHVVMPASIKLPLSKASGRSVLVRIQTAGKG